MFNTYSLVQLEYSISIILLNVISHILIVVLIFSLIFFFNINRLNAFSDLKVFNVLNYAHLVLVLSILTLAGTPPLLGFTTKLIAILFLFKKCNYLYLFLFFFVNIFSVYFYIIIVRFITSQPFLSSSVKKNSFRIKTNVLINSVYMISFISANLLFYNDFLNYFLMVFTFI